MRTRIYVAVMPRDEDVKEERRYFYAGTLWQQSWNRGKLYEEVTFNDAVQLYARERLPGVSAPMYDNRRKHFLLMNQAGQASARQRVGEHLHFITLAAGIGHSRGRVERIIDVNLDLEQRIL
jgi:hypothetical protein